MFEEFPVTKIIASLAADSLLPAILFRTSRRQCDIDIERLSIAKKAILSSAAQEKLRAEIESIMRSYNVEPAAITGHLHFPALITTGVGAHHAGQLLIWRLVLEELMSRGLLRMMIATGTVAAGVDFPARTVVITAHSKRGSDGFKVLTSSEFQQMSGRAGRRGKDAVGICVIAPGPYSDARVIHSLVKLPAEPLRSAYYAAPSTVLNLLKFRNVDDLKFTVSKSLAAFLDKKAARAFTEEAHIRQAEAERNDHMPAEHKKRTLRRVRRMIHEAELLEVRQDDLLNKSLEGLRKLGYVDGGSLSEKGYWAADLCTSLVLELAEAIYDGLFDDLTVEQLVGMVASIAGDPHRNYFGLKPNPIKKDKFKQLEKIVARVRECYSNPAASEVAVIPDAALTVMTWMEAGEWTEFASLLRLAGVAEGDVSRLVTQTADHLNQLSRLIDSHRDLAELAQAGRKKILRPPLIEAIAVVEEF